MNEKIMPARHRPFHQNELDKEPALFELSRSVALILGFLCMSHAAGGADSKDVSSMFQNTRR